LWFCRQVKNCTLFAASYCWSPHLVYVMRQASLFLSYSSVPQHID